MVVASAPTTFIGRRRELATLRGLLSSARLLTLAGTGGIGKTRLAAALARRIRVDQIAWLDLASIRDPRDVAAAFASSLGLPTETVDVASLASALGARRTLIVLDNCEHVLEAAAEISLSVLAASPRSRLLATSRTPLGVAGETVWHVPPLSLAEDDAVRTGALRSDAVRLFLDRARSARRWFAPNELAADDIASICRKLDGVPLAIELAAARTRHMSVAELRARLEVLPPPTPDRDADVRHGSVDAAIEWSHMLLRDADRLMFRRLSIFATDFSLGGAEALGGPELQHESATAVTELVDRSLLDFLPDVDRYRMLEPIRRYAARQLTLSDEEDLALARCAEHLVRRHVHDRRAAASSQSADAERRRDFNNVAAVVPWLIARDPGNALRLLGSYVAAHWTAVPAHLGVLERWLSRALDAYPARDAIRAGGLLACASLENEIRQRDGRFDRRDAFAQEAFTIALEIQDRELEIRARLALANQESPERALAIYDEVIPALAPRGRARSLGLRAVLLQHLGDAKGASRDLAAAFASWDQQAGHSPSERALTHLCAAEVAYRRGDHELAESQLREAIMLRRASGEPQGPAPFVLLAHLAAAGGDAERAFRLDGHAERLWNERGHWPPRLFALSDRRLLLGLERQLGEHAARLRDEGRRWTSAKAISYALGERSRDELTGRERAVALLIVDGLSDKEIAARLGIAERTAQNHVQHIREKLGCRSRVDVARRMSRTAI